ncbi:AraC family transcriptional regulator [Nocardia sp. NPDC050378]|uniref:helix-turn-helix transcriptional regulator n=1 Tax=Nocardia sp. NPDC050378 TaxID=3155400 RepID=UPI003401FD02
MPSDISHGLVEKMSIAHPEAALQAITQAYAPSKLDVFGTAGDFDLRLHVLRLPGITYGHIQFGTDVRVTALPPSCYVVCFAPTGGVRVAATRTNQQVTGQRGAVLYPHEATFFEDWSPASELVSLRIEDDHLERGLVQLIGHPIREPIRFEAGCDLENAQTASFRRALQLLEAELQNPSALAHDDRGAELLADFVTTSLLLSQPNNYSEMIHKPRKAVPLGAVRAAQELMDADPMSINTVGELANRVHTSVRSLEQGFRTHLDTTPMTYLRRTRLAHAHRELQVAASSNCTVRRIAHRWGFQHLGRFARCYREAFGELPAETLRSGRR